MLLLLAAVAVSIAVDYVQIFVPSLYPLNPCARAPGWSSVLSLPAGGNGVCQWITPDLLAEHSSRTFTVQISEAGKGVVDASVKMRLPAGDPLVAKIRQGDAASDPGTFMGTTFGEVAVNDLPLNWSAPVMDDGSPGTVEVSVTGTLKTSLPQRVTAIFSGSGTVRVTSPSLLVAGINGQGWPVTSQNAHSATLAFTTGTQGPVNVDLTTSGPPAGGLPVMPAPEAWWRVIAKAAWQLLRGFAGNLLPAVAWVCLFLAGRAGALGPLGRRMTWRRLDRVLAMVLLAHLAISAAAEISNQEGAASGVLASPVAALIDTAVSHGTAVPAGYFAVSGGTVLLIVAVLCGAMWWARPVVKRPGSRGPGPALSLLGLLAVLAAFIVVAGLAWVQVSLARSGAPRYADVGLAVSASAAGLVPLLICLWLLARLALRWQGSLAPVPGTGPAGQGTGPRDRARWPIVPVAGVALGAATLASLSLDSGIVPVLVRWGVVIAAGTVMGLAVVRLIGSATLWHPAGRLPRAAVLVAAAVAVPWGIIGGSQVGVGWSAVVTYALRIDNLLPLVLLAAAAAAFRYLGSGPVAGRRRLLCLRRLGILSWFIVLSSSYTLAGTLSWPAVAATVTAAAGGWLLMPADQVSRASRVLGQSREQQEQAVQATVRAGAARRLVPAYSKGMHEQVASGKLRFDRAQAKIAELERIASSAADEGTAPARGGTADNASRPASTEQLGFGDLTSRRPWRRGLWGALAGAVTGAPWVLLGIAGVSVQLGTGEGYPELAILAAVAPLVARWTIYGFAFGYFYPLLRGSTGMGKAVWFTAAAIGPAVLSTAALGHGAGERWQSVVVLVVQIATFATTLGVLADRAVLRKYRLPLGRLVDVHNLWTVSAWASALGVAAATGIATVLIAGLQPFVIGLITPSTTPVQPALHATPPAVVNQK